MKIYMIGIKGSGMSALALVLNDKGYEVMGSDIDEHLFTEDNLRNKNIKIYPLSDKTYTECDIVIIGHNFMSKDLELKLNSYKLEYYEYNDYISKFIDNSKLVCIAGSHGKTTLTSMLHHVIPSSFLSGDGNGSFKSDNDVFFLEACEYKNHFLVYEPSFSIITNIDYDHVDFFKTVEEYNSSFKTFSLNSKLGLINFKDSEKIKNPFFYTYGFEDEADFIVRNYSSTDIGIKGDVYFKNHKLISFQYPHMYGLHLILDVLAVYSFGYLNGYNLEDINKNFYSYKMACKRFNLKRIKDSIIITDYGHHPTQIKANYETIKNAFKNMNYYLFYKPDRISRLSYFKNEFVESFHLFDKSFIINFNDYTYRDYLKTLEDENTKYVRDMTEITSFIDFSKPSVYLLSSSKSLDDVKHLLEDGIINNRNIGESKRHKI